MKLIPKGLLTRAGQRQLMGDASGDTSDLNEAWEIAEQGNMPLYQADMPLTRARLCCREDLAMARDNLTKARRLIENHSYHRRDGELANAEAARRALTDQGEALNQGYTAERNCRMASMIWRASTMS